MRTGLRAVPCMLAIGCLAIAPARGNITFNLMPEPDTPQHVIDAFELAAARWAAVLANDITVNLTIGFPALPAGILGQTINTHLTADYSSVTAALYASSFSDLDASAYAHLPSGTEYTRLINRTSDNPNGPNSATPYVDTMEAVYVTRANAKALGLLAASDDPDGGIRFSANVAFDFDPTDGTTGGQYDFVTVASHEMGHILGFASTVDQIEQAAGSSPAAQLPSSVLDLFRFSSASLAQGPGVMDTAADARSKFFSVDGGATTVAGFATGAVYGGGYQASHWREFTFRGLMDPHLFIGLQRQLSATDLTAFDVIGYRLVPEPSATALLMLGLATLLSGRRRRPR